MKMGISQKLGNGGGRQWKLNSWEWDGIGMLKAIPAHLYYVVLCIGISMMSITVPEI